ncbi:rab guanine nucleotide exchange factor S2 [Fusarium falciforme]|uniref:Rab guanine nucleotide exchange factor S2 n=1 Tax=Fusarium falciforme TaxID=195108 RepID=A0A9W8QXU9_9HYPO|nr:rab guanine nucleotide exchange factor S2 [Fusarium falciforme]KAJ4179337.1 rab guanine nucleotide exchange factor S2 [Fusarium falciforme]
MDSFIPMSAAAAGWGQPLATTSPASRRSLGHFRSLSSIASVPSHKPRTPSTITPDHTPVKSSSSTHLPIGSPAPIDLGDEMSTLPDPRSRGMSPADDGSISTPNHHPDLNDEVATLSTKLINAINHQTILDDSLSAARHELDTARDRIRILEAQNASQREMLAGDVWIRKHTVEAEKKVWQAKIAEERQKRLDTEKDKKKIEQELENLTAALFEEANKMVIAAKEEAKADHEVLQRKNDQLKAQLADSESLLKSQQEQLSELKHVMEHMAAERDDQTNPTAPSSPGFAKSDSLDDQRTSANEPSPSPWVPAAEPSHPTSFTHLIQPVLRTDLTSYDDFVSLARVSRNRAGSRVSSGSMGALTALSSFGLGGSTSSAHPSNASTTSLNTTGQAVGSAPQSPNTPASTISAASNASVAPLPSLKETKFYKRVLAEDIEPTLRLDMAPGLSWLARRTVINSIAEGSLVVEPVPTTGSFIALTKPQFYPCSLCGDSRKDPIYLRTHRFRTSETDSAQRHPLCKYCLNRVRSTCDFLGFLRMVKDGHWRADDENHEKAAWEESVRLREQMFWSRIGGGVIPNTQAPLSVDLEKSPRTSREESVVSDHLSVPGFQTPPMMNIDRTRNEKVNGPIQEPHTPPLQTDGARSVRSSIQSLDVKSSSGSEDTKRLSITIPSADQ